MGFSSIDDYLNQTTNLGVSSALQTCRYDWNKLTPSAGSLTSSRWYDLSYFNGSPPTANYGEMVQNQGPYGSAWGWTLGSAQWTYANGTPNGLFSHVATSAATLSQNISFTNGVTYLVIFTLAWTSGTVTVSVNGTSGTARGSAATFTELIVAGASGGLVFTPSSTAVLSVSNISVVCPLKSYQLIDTNVNVGTIYHGGNVSTKTKHVINTGVTAAINVLNQCFFMLCDMLLVYPGINLNSTSPQTLTTTATLPRYTDGVGVKTFIVYTTIAGATTQYISLSYTNTTSSSGRNPPSTIQNQGASASVAGHIMHSSSSTLNYQPFIPMQAGDKGITSAESVTFSAAGTAGTYAALVLCRPLLTFPLTSGYYLSERNFMNQLPSLPRIYDGAYLGWLFCPCNSVSASSSLYGYMDFAWA